MTRAGPTWGTTRLMSRAAGPTARQHRTPQRPRVTMRFPLGRLPACIIPLPDHSPPQREIRGLRAARCDQERRVGFDGYAGAIALVVGDDRAQHPGTQEVVVKHQDWNLESTGAVGPDVRRKRRPKNPAVPVQESDRTVRRKTASDCIRHETGRSDRWIECQRWLVAGNLVIRVVRFPLPEVVGADQVDALRWLDDLDGPAEVAEHTGLGLEALRQTAGSGIERDQHRTERIEIVTRDRRRSHFG